MIQKHLAMSRFAIAVLAAVLTALGLSGQESRHTQTPMTWDWSNRHLVFSNPRTTAQASRVRKDLRYQQQWLRRNAPARVADSGAPEVNALLRIPWGPPVLRNRRRTPAFRRDWSTSLGVSASVPTIAASMPPSAFPAKFSFDIDTASCGDFVVFTTNLPGATDLGLVAFNNLYAGSSPAGVCTGPTPLFAYQTQTNGGVTSTSPVISFFDSGAQIAFMEGGGGVGVLHVLRWNSGDGGTVSAPVAVETATTAGSGYVSCKATTQSCLLSLAFSNGAEDTHSAPFVDYENDNLYVGDDTGVLHKFTGVFSGRPVEMTSGGWPVTVDAAEALTSPVYDSASNNIYVGDRFGVLSFVKDAPGSSVGSCVSGTAPCLGDNTISTNSGEAGGITDAPIVDSTNGTVFVFVGTDGPASGDNSAVFQAPTTLASSVEATVGPSAINSTTFTFNPVYSGAFDNNYFTAPSSGFLYVCGNQITPTNLQNAALYRIGFNASGTMNANNDGMRLDISQPVSVFFPSVATTCSPGTEIFNSNNGTDLMFFSVQNNSNLTNCPATIGGGGCVMSFDTTSGFPSSVANSAPEDGGTSGIIIDNTVTAATTPQAASLYFTRLAGSACPTGATGCVVKLTQAGFK